MFEAPLHLRSRGLFITATDTEVGKTTIACAIAAAIRGRGIRVGVCKPIATGCRLEREGLVSGDAEQLAHFSDCRLPLHVINPVRYRAPLAPAVAAEQSGRPIDEAAIAESLRRIDAASDVLLVEGIGGLLVPLDERRTVLDLARWVGYPVLIVTCSTLGTLNHTAMTCALLHRAGLRLAGLAINRYHPDAHDIAEQTNLRWLARQNRTRVLATVPETAGLAPTSAPAPGRVRLPPAVLEAIDVTDWLDVCARAGG